MRVADLMKTALKTISTDATVLDAVDALARSQVSALPVVDRFGRAVGIVTTRDVLKAESACASPNAREQLFERTLALEIMTPWAATISPSADVTQAARRMLDLNVQRLFVEDGGRLVGVISQTDLVGVVATARL